MFTQLNNLTEGVTKVAIPAVSMDILDQVGDVAFVLCKVDIFSFNYFKIFLIMLELKFNLQYTVTDT